MCNFHKHLFPFSEEHAHLWESSLSLSRAYSNCSFYTKVSQLSFRREFSENLYINVPIKTKFRLAGFKFGHWNIFFLPFAFNSGSYICRSIISERFLFLNLFSTITKYLSNDIAQHIFWLPELILTKHLSTFSYL